MKTSSEGKLLPKLEPVECPGCKPEFLAGDVRALGNPGLSALHTVFVREHNRIAKVVAADVPQWSDEVVYQVTRRYECHYVEYSIDTLLTFLILFKELNPFFSPVHKYSEFPSRIVIAQMQNIVYGQYLPHILGPETMVKYGLGIDQASTYHPDMDPSITNAFATAAFRFGHSMIRNVVKMIDIVSAAESTYRYT